MLDIDMTLFQLYLTFSDTKKKGTEKATDDFHFDRFRKHMRR